MSDEEAGQGRGRPQKFPGEGARISHSLRLKPAVAERLRIAAQAANRTLGEEMEVRINASFDEEDLLADAIDDEVAKRTYIIAREAEFRRLQAEWTHYHDILNVAEHKRYIYRLEGVYFETKLRAFKRLSSFISNRLFRFAILEQKTTEIAAEKGASDMKSNDKDIAFITESLEHTKSKLNEFYMEFPEIYKSEYNEAIKEAVQRVNKNWKKNRRVAIEMKQDWENAKSSPSDKDKPVSDDASISVPSLEPPNN